MTAWTRVVRAAPSSTVEPAPVLEAGDAVGAFELLAELVVLDGQPLDDGLGDFQGRGQAAVVAPQAAVVVFQRLQPSGSLVFARPAAACGGDLLGVLREVAPERGVGHAQAASESDDGGPGPEFGAFGQQCGLGGEDVFLARQR